jgi:tetratricopeptide (TPR) repeat protein
MNKLNRSTSKWIILAGGLTLSALLLSGCKTPSWLEQKRWKDKPTPVDMALVKYEEGVKFEMQGEWDKASIAYEEANKISPRPVAYYRLGMIAATNRQYDKAKFDFQKALELNPNYKEAADELKSLPANGNQPAPEVSKDTAK